MQFQNPIGNRELVSAIGLASVLLILTCCIFPRPEVVGDAGICFPSPNEWHIAKFLGWLLNSALIFFSVFMISACNRKYNFLSLADPIVSTLLLVTLSSNCLTTASLSSATLLLAINVICINFLFDTFERYNATHQFFSIATFISVGSMFQYAFVMMIPVYVAGGFLMKTLRIKELLAFGLGLIAPYWILIGLGIVSLDAIKVPGLLSGFEGAGLQTDYVAIITTLTITGVVALIFALYNGITLMNRNSRLRCMHTVFNIMGVVALICIFADFNNFLAYSSILYFWFTIQIANYFALYHTRSNFLWILVLTLFYLASYIIII